ncbi:MAG TPA: twin-arginine translocase TatA/TatE family subunit [Rubrobacteraceae bacterium]|nr:twin-arginine translocase TatA/TatE family subunit [Rubrobacteraceae bacterium]
MFSGLESPTHLLLLLVIILLLFGAKRLPEMGRSLGRGIQEFREGLNTKEEPEKTEEQKYPETIEEEKGRLQGKPRADDAKERGA